VLSTSFRDAIQATDSTCRGWRANRNATRALRQRAPVILRRRRRRRTEFAMCRRRLVRWCFPASSPKSSTSVMWESQVRG